MSSGSVGGIRRPTTSSAPAPNSSSPDPTMSAPASMIGICTANRCGRLMSSASIRATTSCRQAASPASSAGPEADVAVELQHVDGDGAGRGQLRDAVGEHRVDRAVPDDHDVVRSAGLVEHGRAERLGEVARVGRVATRAAAATTVRARRLLFVTVWPRFHHAASPQRRRGSPGTRAATPGRPRAAPDAWHPGRPRIRVGSGERGGTRAGVGSARAGAVGGIDATARRPVVDRPERRRASDRNGRRAAPRPRRQGTPRRAAARRATPRDRAAPGAAARPARRRPGPADAPPSRPRTRPCCSGCGWPPSLASALVLLVNGTAWGLYRDVTAGITTTTSSRRAATAGRRTSCSSASTAAPTRRATRCRRRCCTAAHRRRQPARAQLRHDHPAARPRGRRGGRRLLDPARRYVDIPGYRTRQDQCRLPGACRR